MTTIVFVSGTKIVVHPDDPEETVRKLAKGAWTRFAELAGSNQPVWVNPLQVLFVH